MLSGAVSLQILSLRLRRSSIRRPPKPDNRKQFCGAFLDAVARESKGVFFPAPRFRLFYSFSAFAGSRTMSTEVVMPQMGESITEGTVSKWLKNVGDRIEKDEAI